MNQIFATFDKQTELIEPQRKRSFKQKFNLKFEQQDRNIHCLNNSLICFVTTATFPVFNSFPVLLAPHERNKQTPELTPSPHECDNLLFPHYRHENSTIAAHFIRREPFALFVEVLVLFSGIIYKRNRAVVQWHPLKLCFFCDTCTGKLKRRESSSWVKREGFNYNIVEKRGKFGSSAAACNYISTLVRMITSTLKH